MTDDLKTLAARVLSRNRLPKREGGIVAPVESCMLHTKVCATPQLSESRVQPSCNLAATIGHNVPDSQALSGNLPCNPCATAELHRGTIHTPLPQPLCNPVADSDATSMAGSSAPEPSADDIDADREALLERAAIMEYDGDLPRADAEQQALTSTRFRVWRLTLDDGSTCIQFDPDAPTIAEFQPHRGMAYRVVSWEPVAASALHEE